MQIVLGEGGLSLAAMARNIGFLIKNVPWAAKKAEEHFHKALETAREVGMKGVLGQTYLDLGILPPGQAPIPKRPGRCLSPGHQCFEECEAESLLRKAREVAASLN